MNNNVINSKLLVLKKIELFKFFDICSIPGHSFGGGVCVAQVHHPNCFAARSTAAATALPTPV